MAWRSPLIILALLIRVGARAQGEDAASLARRGMDALRKGDLVTAEPLCRRAHEAAPDFRDAYTCLYNVFNNTDRFEEGLAEAAAALKRKPGDDFHSHAMARTYSRRGEKRLKAKDYDGARKDFESALKIIPDEGIALDELGVIHYLRKDYREAIRYFNRSLKLDQGFAPNYVWRGRCFHAVGRPVMALADYERAKNLKPALWKSIQADIDAATTASMPKSARRPIKNIRAIIYTMNALHSEWNQEIARYAAPCRKRPGDSDACYFRGALSFELGDGEKAAADFQKAIDLYPEFWGKRLPDLIRQAKTRRRERN